MLGRVVESRDLGMQSAGAHEFQYDAVRLATGVYFYRVSAGDVSQTRKMMLLK